MWEKLHPTGIWTQDLAYQTDDHVIEHTSISKYTVYTVYRWSIYIGTAKCHRNQQEYEKNVYYKTFFIRMDSFNATSTILFSIIMTKFVRKK